MAKVELKAPIIDEIKGHVSEAKAAVVVNYCGITVEQDTELRKKLREAGVVYKVYKNTFLKRAFEGTDYAQLDKVLDGPTAVAFSRMCYEEAKKIINEHMDVLHRCAELLIEKERITREEFEALFDTVPVAEA